jgi:hypothetical protein
MQVTKLSLTRGGTIPIGYQEFSMKPRESKSITVTMKPELAEKATARSQELGVSITEYIRILARNDFLKAKKKR